MNLDKKTNTTGITNRLAKTLLVCFFAALTFSACDKDNNGMPPAIITFLDSEAEAYKGLKVVLNITQEGYANQSEMKLLVGGIEVDDYSIVGWLTEEGGNTYELEFDLPSSLEPSSEANVVLQIRDKTVQGPVLKIGTTYYSSFFGSNSLGPKNMAMTAIADGKIATVSDGTMRSSLSNVSFEASGIDNNFRPVIEYIWGPDFVLPQSPTGNNPANFLSEVRLGMDMRNGITYFPLSYSSSVAPQLRHYLAQEFRNQIDFCGTGVYTQSTFGGFITDVRVDIDGNIFVIDDSKPNCIQKMSVAKSPVVWVGSATESGSVNGKGTSARFEDVVSLQRDSKDNLYVAQKNVIRKITPSGEVTTLSKFTFEGIIAFAVAPDDRIYVLDVKDQTKLTIINASQTGTSSARILDKLNPGYTSSIIAQNMAVGTDGIVYMRAYMSSIGNSSVNILIPN